MTKKTYPRGPALPRAAIAGAAIAATLAWHGALLGLFHGQAPRQQLLATPAIEQRLAACAAQPGRAERRACQLAVVEQAVRGPDLTIAVRH